MYNFILNPTAGKGKALNAISRIKDYLDKRQITYEVFSTKYPRHATELAAKLSANKCKNIIAVGGDGTVNEVLNGIVDFETCNLGIIPCGTGNDFAKFIKLPNDAVEAMKVVLESDAVYTDFLTLGENRVMNICGMGMDVTVLERCKRMRFLKGKLQYYVSLIITLLKFKWYNYEVSIDGGEFNPHTVMMIGACNGKYFGGGMPISPESDLHDNKLNVIIINKMPKYKIPFALILLMKGKILKYSFVQNIKCESVFIQSKETPKINLDGEIYSNLVFDCKIVKNQLKLYRSFL